MKMEINYIVVTIVIAITCGQQMAQETCDDITWLNGAAETCTSYELCYSQNSMYWYQTNFWGGYFEIAWNESSISLCSEYYTNRDFLVLMDEPPVREDMNETVLSLEACIRNNNGICKEKVNVQIRNCGGSIIVRTPSAIGRRLYACIDYIFTGDCNDSVLIFSSELVSENVIKVMLGGEGWYNTIQEEKQYTFPSTEFTETIFDACPDFDYHFLLRDPVPETVDERPVKLVLCRVIRVSTETGSFYNKDCTFFTHVRKCNGKLQFETTWLWTYVKRLCLVLLNSVKVIPEIEHTTDYDNTVVMYRPFLQFRCSFEMDNAVFYKIKWYINDILNIETGPSNSSKDLALKGDDINDMELGYMVTCGVIEIATEESPEKLSYSFFAGWKIKDKEVTVIKGGSISVAVVLTVPIGCTYAENKEANCIEELSIADISDTTEECKGRLLATNADDRSKSYQEVHTLKKSTEWNGSKEYRFDLTTVDVYYDDPTVYYPEVRVTNGAGTRSRKDVRQHIKVIETLKINVSEAWRHLNKKCYSHIDPHMRTADGRNYEQHREGDYILLRNIAQQMEIQESTRYCYSPRFSRNRPPVCACGIAIRFGADVFMINICGNLNFLDFVQCGDGGILEVVRVDDFHYRVRAPTGTVIDITMYGPSKIMNIDIYMSPRDFGNIDGLCGYFDGNVANDFRRRDGNYSTGNDDYKFSDSWRLSEEENFFKRFNRSVEPWKHKDNRQICSRMESITLTKCKIKRRFKRDNNDLRRHFERLNPFMSNQESMRLKRNTQDTVLADDIESICNASIFESPAVMEMQDKLADEDLSEVVSQCVFDVTEGNDTVWVNAHVQALSDTATTVLDLNPVYVANNTEVVKAFLKQTCLNNCSGNGVCSETGHCSCYDPYRGPDCGIDLRIPPIIIDIEGGGLCDVATDNDCECFVIRTDNIFDGFVCNFSTYMVNFNGTRSQVGHSQNIGEYEDIFTGICCVTGEQITRIENINDPFVVMYELSISNDELNYGEIVPVYIYDTTCIQQVLVNDKVEVEIKPGHCFIDNTCVKQGSSEQGGDQCNACNSHLDPFTWYKGDCDVDRTESTPWTLIGIIIGSVLGCAVIVFVTSMLLFKAGKKYRAVKDVQSPMQTRAEDTLYVREPYCKDAVSNIKDELSETADVGVHDPVNCHYKNVVKGENTFYTGNQPMAEVGYAEGDGANDALKFEPPHAKYERGISSISLKV